MFSDISRESGNGALAQYGLSTLPSGEMLGIYKT